VTGAGHTTTHSGSGPKRRVRESFAFETTLSGRTYMQHIREWRAAGYRVKLIFLQLDDVGTAIRRVAQRVRQGGHHIPEETIRRRFVAGLENFQRLYKPLADSWALYDNTGPQPLLLDWSENHEQAAHQNRENRAR